MSHAGELQSLAEQAEAHEHKHRPKLRGLSHSLAFFGVVGLGVPLLSSPLRGLPKLGAAIYVVCSAVMFGLSGLYHFPDWSHATLRVLRRLDHAGVFLMISGSYTAFWTLTPEGARSPLLLTVMWVACVSGAVTFAAWTHMPRWLRATTYSVVGLSSIPLVLKLPLVLGWPRTGWVAFASAVYVLGSVVYARRWPNPNPKWFGYHEVFHLMVVGAAAIQFLVVLEAHYR